MRTFRLLALAAFFCLSLSLPIAFAEESAAEAVVESDDIVEVAVPPVVEDVVDTPEEDDEDEAEPFIDTTEEEAEAHAVAEAEAKAAAKAAAEAAAATAAAEAEAAAETEALLKESEELSVPVSFIKDTVLSKVSDITSKISITKENAKKTAAFALGTWGAATGIGWAVQQMGAGKQD